MNRVITITTGRSGIHFLGKLFARCTDLPRTGEPEYFPNDLPSKERAERDEEFRRQMFLRAWETMPDPFVSTSLFPKNGYLKLLGNKGARFMYLYRDCRKTCISWMKMDGVPGKTWRGKTYHPNPELETNCYDISSTWKELSNYQLCVWAWLEVRERAKYLVARGYPVREVELEVLSKDPMKVADLFKWCRVEFKHSDISDILFYEPIPNAYDNIPLERRGGAPDFFITKEKHEEEVVSLLQKVKVNSNGEGVVL